MGNVKGYVYVLSNKSMPGIVKIGFSLKDPSIRAAELEGTGVPHPFVVEYFSLVEAPFDLEQLVHQTLDDRRERKEFFRISCNEAISIIERLISETGRKILYKENNSSNSEYERLRSVYIQNRKHWIAARSYKIYEESGFKKDQLECGREAEHILDTYFKIKK